MNIPVDCFTWKRVFAASFFYTLCVGAMLQLYVLPIMFPSIHAGHGLLAGGDWVGFDQSARSIAEQIQREGWAIWQLKPDGNAPIGIAAAFYALTGISEPWVQLPLNSILFAVGATCLFEIFSAMASKGLAFLAILPYILIPSALEIYGQIHKDVWSIAGYALIMYSLFQFALSPLLTRKSLTQRSLLTLIGVILIWIVRPYLLQTVLLASVLVVLVISGNNMHSLLGKTLSHDHRRWWFGAVLCVVIIAAFLKVSSGEGITSEKTISSKKTVTQGKTITSEVGNNYIAQYVNEHVYRLSQARKGFETTPGGSNLDTNVEFQTIFDLLNYIPRALQIGLLAPFPDTWQQQGQSVAGNKLRLIAAMEMLLAYVLLIGIAILFIQFPEKRNLVFILLVFAMVPLVLLSLVVANVGTLYRMRYEYWQVLLGLGVLGWGSYWNQRVLKRG